MVSYHPDPEAFAVNAFYKPWVGYEFYALLPFSIVNQNLQKIQKEGSDSLVKMSKWTTHSAAEETIQQLLVKMEPIL